MSMCRKCDRCGRAFDPPSNFISIAKKESQEPTGHVRWTELCAACVAKVEQALKECAPTPEPRR